MQITVTIDDLHPNFHKVLAALSMAPTALKVSEGAYTTQEETANLQTLRSSYPEEAEAEVEKPKPEEVEKPKEPKVEEPKVEEPKVEEPKVEEIGAGTKKPKEITLKLLQEMATELLQAGERRTFRSILDEVGVQSLSTAPESDYDKLWAKLDLAVKELGKA